MADTTIRIAILLFDNFTALDVIGPYEVLSKIPNTKVYFTGKEKKEYKDQHGLTLNAEYLIDEMQEADVLLIPGGFGIDALLQDKIIIDWIYQIDKTTKWTTAVCSGSILLAESGLLNGKNCTTHWRRKDQLKKYSVVVKNERYVHDGKYITSAGVSAGIDMALYLVSKIGNDNIAKMIQLAIEYDPMPPFDCGSPNKAPKEFLEKMK